MLAVEGMLEALSRGDQIEEHNNDHDFETVLKAFGNDVVHQHKLRYSDGNIVTKHENNYFENGDIVKITTIDGNEYIGQVLTDEYIREILKGIINELYSFELCLADNSLMPFYKDNIAKIEKANDDEVFSYASKLSQNIKLW